MNTPNSYITKYENQTSETLIFAPITEKVSTLRLVTGDAPTGSFSSTIRCAYSVDGLVWSELMTEQQINLLIPTLTYNELYIKVDISVVPSTGAIATFFVLGAYLDGYPLTVERVELGSSQFVAPRLNGNLWRYQDQMSQYHDIRSVLNKSLSDSLGLRTTYFLTSNNGLNRTLKTYTVHNVVSVQDLNILIDDKNTPTNELDFDEYFSYYATFEAYIDKTEWATVFGSDTTPTPKDSFYLHPFSKMLTISKVIDERNFLDKSVCWKISLVKYSDDGAINTELADEIISDFSMFVDGAGINQSIPENIEYQNATGVNSTINNTELNEDTVMHNYHGVLIQRMEGLTAIRKALTHKGVLGVDWMYKTPNIDAQSLITKYDISKYKVDTHSINFWYETDTISDKLITRTEYDNKTVHELYLQKEGNIRFVVYNATNQKQEVYTPNITPMVSGQLYNIHINKSKSLITLTVSTYSNGLVTQQEKVHTSVLTDSPIDTLTFFGQQTTCIGHVQVTDSVIGKNDLLTHLFSSTHEVSVMRDDCSVVDEQNPNTSGLIDTFGFADGVVDC